MAFYHDPNLLTLAFILAMIVLVLFALFALWLSAALSRDPKDQQAAPCGAYGLCKAHHDCLDHSCPGHPVNTARRGCVVRLHTRSGAGERVDTTEMKG